jgi:hypothetical protein
MKAIHRIPSRLPPVLRRIEHADNGDTIAAREVKNEEILEVHAPATCACRQIPDV